MTEPSPPVCAWIATYDASFADLAQAEIAQAAGDTFKRRELAPGLTLVEAGASFADAAHGWREHPPVFVRHICPAQSCVPLLGEGDNLAAIEASALAMCAPLVDSARRFSVQTRVLGDAGFKPYDVNTRLADAFAKATGAQVDVRDPEQVVSIVCVADAGDAPAAYIGLSDVEDNLSDWAGGIRRFAREPDQVSRSEFKLLEALDVFQIELPPRGVALDLGAAPGGWTRVLRLHAQYVTAVDPGELHALLQKDSGVRHVKATAEQYLDREPDRFDLVVNDMRMDGRDSARLMVRYAPYLYRGGIAIMTLKLPERGRRAVIDHSLRILTNVYEILGVRHLFHNRSEITLYLARRDDIDRYASDETES